MTTSQLPNLYKLTSDAIIAALRRAVQRAAPRDATSHITRELPARLVLSVSYMVHVQPHQLRKLIIMVSLILLCNLKF